MHMPMPIGLRYRSPLRRTREQARHLSILFSARNPLSVAVKGFVQVYQTILVNSSYKQWTEPIDSVHSPCISNNYSPIGQQGRQAMTNEQATQTMSYSDDSANFIPPPIHTGSDGERVVVVTLPNGFGQVCLRPESMTLADRRKWVGICGIDMRFM